MWPFALKEATFWLNCLSLHSDGRSCEATFFNVDKDLFNPTTFHVFGLPCFVLVSRLQSGIAGPPKWEPRSRLGIYVGHSPSHAGLVALVLNPRTEHVSPQFHVVFDDFFSTVSYMKQSKVPPNWSELVEKSTEQVTDKDFDLAKTWLFPDADSGDIALDANSDTMLLPLGDSNNSTTALSSGHHISQIDFSRSSDVPGISSIDSVPRPHLDPANDSLLSLHDEHLAPALINLETSGLQRSPRLAALQLNLDSPSIATYTSSTIPSSSRLISKPRPRLSFLSVFNLIGSLWTFATMGSHIDDNTLSFVARLLNDYDRLNGLFDDTINNICHQFHAFATSNESFTYL